MIVMVVGMVVFLGIHSARIIPGLRANLVQTFGEMAYKGIYSILSLIGLIFIWRGYSMAREAGQPLLYYPPLWLTHLTLLLMAIALICFAAAYVPGRIKAALKHPMLVSIKIWALAHLLANGELHSIVLFGGFLAWAVVDRISVKRRERAGLAVPFTLPADTPPANDLIAVVIGATAYVAILLWLHPILFGVAIVL
ncbi:MAG: NnrU family protein [Pseudomonadota bacterium]